MKIEMSLHEKNALILNKMHSNEDFYFELFKIPEILNRLCQYREVLRENAITLPFWLYNLTEKFKIHAEVKNQSYMIHFLTNLGLFDRYLSRKGWPKYIIGTDPLISVILGELSFEEAVLLFSKNYCQDSSFWVYEIFSYYNAKIGEFYLSSFKKRETGNRIEDMTAYLKKKKVFHKCFFQLLSPHSQETIELLNAQGIFPRDFLESDTSLKWLWPLWKREQIKNFRKLTKKTFKTKKNVF
ncbi:MAG: hypothetical protein GDA46_05965 [Bdellovibrionales bacterium]|nr:hypothetical protein [Bdellovibrionales bacterium]